jgi:uncharacterized ferritin-like protein (DUF455 family)
MLRRPAGGGARGETQVREETVRTFCRRVLACGDLAAKLRPPLRADGSLLADRAPGPALRIDVPARSPDLVLVAGAGALPRPYELADPAARARCLARFAHHELMAVELLAWALLRWPDLPPTLRRGWLAVLAEEQIHCRLYLARLRAHGSALADHALSDYFWRQVPAIEAAPDGPQAFLAALGLTLEQANLDFAPLYRDAFRQAGDEETARVCERVHADEIRHVRFAAVWLRRLAPRGLDEVGRYEGAVPFPLSAARAKGRRFDAAARRRAGLGEPFIAHVRSARSTQERARPRCPSPPAPS